MTLNAVSDMRNLRHRVARVWRTLWPVVVIAAGAITCDAPSGPGGRSRAQISVVPDFSQLNLSRFAGLTVDQVRLLAIRPGPPPETLTTQTFAFPADSSAITINLDVDVDGTEQILVVFDLLAGTQVMFTGSQMVTATEGSTTQPSAPIVPSFVGPGSNVGSLHITPRDSGTGLGGTFPFSVTALDSGQQAVASFYVSWSTNATAASGHTVNGAGVFRAGNSRGRVWVHAETPSGIKDSTTVSITPVPTSVGVFSGSGQSGAADTPLPQPLVARVLAADGLPVVGVPVTFSVTAGGGAVFPTTVATDTQGLAATLATLGSSGAQTFRAVVPGVGTAAVFTASIASQPSIVLGLVDGGNVVGVGGTRDLIVTLSQPAPSGGVVVNLLSDSSSYLRFGTAVSTTVPMPQGTTRDTIPVNGLAAGVARITATAIGHDTTRATFVVLPPIIALTPANLGVLVSGTASLGIQLNVPAPAGGLSVSLTSTDTTIARVTGTVNVPAGQTAGAATVTGVAGGTAGITATAPGYTQGAAVVTVGSTAATLTKTAGDGLTAFLNDTTATRPRVLVLNAGGQPVAGVVVSFTIGLGGGTIAGTSAAPGTSDANGFASPPGPWRVGASAGANTLTAAVPAVPAVPSVTFTATAQLPPPLIQLSIFGSNVVGQARSGTLNVRLLQAPAGALAVSLTTRTGHLYIGAYGSENGTVNFTGGAADTLRTIAVFGDSSQIGLDSVFATAPGYTGDTLAVPVSQNLISLPTTLNVPLSQNVSVPINLSVAAPAGGLKVAIQSDNPAAVQVLTDTVVIAAGSQVGNGTIRGAGLGTANVLATNPNYAQDESFVTTRATLNITTGGTLFPNESFGTPIVVQLESGGTPVPAPAGGIPLTFAANDPACVAGGSTSIPAGLVSTTVIVSYGGSATTPCTTRLFVTGPAGFDPDSINVLMQPKPTVTSSNTYLGSGLQRASFASLSASNHGGTTIRVTSLNPSVAIIARNDTSVGAAFQDFLVPVNGSGVNFYMQALDGITEDSADIVLSAAGFTPDTMRLSVYQPAFDLIFLNSSGNTRSANDAFQARTGSSASRTGTLNSEDGIRFGGAPLVVTIVNDSAAVAELITTALSADTVTVTIPANNSRSPSSVATGGVELDFTAAGVTGVRATAPGYRATGAALGQAVTVTAPVLTLSSTYIGARLQRGHSISLGAAGIAGDTVTLRVTQPGILKISPNDSTGFADSIRVGVPVGSGSVNFFIQGVDSIISDSVDVIATMPSFTADTARFTVHMPVVDVIFLNSSATTRTANDAFQVRIGSAFTATGTINSEDVLRFGHPAVTFSVLNDSALVGELHTTALDADSVTVQIGARQSRSPSTVATGGVEFDYVAGGVTNVRAHGPLFRSVGSGLGQAVTVTAPVINLGATYIGARLQRGHSVSFGATAIAGDTVTLRVSRPGVLRISPNDSTGFADSIQVGVTPGQSSASFFIQGVDTVTSDSVFVIATMPAFTTDSARFTVHRGVFDIIFLNSTANALQANDDFQVRIGSASTASGTINSEDVLRFGHAPLIASVKSSAATTAQLVTTAATGDSVTVNIGPRQSRSPSTLATGGVQLDYLTTGSTVVTANIPQLRVLPTDTQTVTVTAPVASLSNSTVASGLQEGASGNLSSPNHGGIDVVIKSSNPALLLVSPNATTPGTDSIVITLTNGSSSFGYYVQGVEGHTGAPQQVSVRATAPGFTDGVATMTVMQPAVDIIFLSGSGTTATTDDAFNARVGWSSDPNGQNMSAEQAVRAGAPDSLTVQVTSTIPAVGGLTTSTQTAVSTVTLKIAPGQARTPSSLATGGAQFDFLTPGVTFVVPVITNYLTMQQTVLGTPGFRVNITP